MKNIKKGGILLSFLLTLPLFSSCGGADSCTLEEFLNNLNEAQNYTYSYEFKPKEGEGFSYIDKFTSYGMYSKIVEDKNEGATDFGYLVNDEDGVFSYIIEKDQVVPGRAIRDDKGEKRTSYNDLIVALDDLNVDNVESKPYIDEFTYKITNKNAMNTILESSMVNFDIGMASLKAVSINTKFSNNIEIRGDFGEEGQLIGHVTDIGNTKLEKGKAYIDEGKRAFTKDTIDPGLKTIIDKFKTNNYTAPLLQIWGGSALPIGTKKFYEYTSSNGTKAIVYYSDYDSLTTVDSGLIEIHDGDLYDGVYKFISKTDKQQQLEDGEIKEIESDENPHYTLTIGEQAKVNGTTPVKTFKEILNFPTSLDMFGDEALLMDYNEAINGYLSTDYLLALQLCLFFGYQHTISFAEPNFAGVTMQKDENNEDVIGLIYSWRQDGNPDMATLPFTNFGKVKLPMIDEYMEAHYGN